jgi:hypothetical protein
LAKSALLSGLWEVVGVGKAAGGGTGAAGRAAPGEIGLLVEVLDHAFDRPAWHGTNLRGSIRRISVDEALWRPMAGRHCIWEIVLHCAYYKYVQARRIDNDPVRGGFPRKPSGWPALPGRAGETAWRQDVELLVEYHQRLREAALRLDALRLQQRNKSWTNAQHLHGAAMHDIYHAGQIQLLKRLQRTRGRS